MDNEVRADHSCYTTAVAAGSVQSCTEHLADLPKGGGNPYLEPTKFARLKMLLVCNIHMPNDIYAMQHGC